MAAPTDENGEVTTLDPDVLGKRLSTLIDEFDIPEASLCVLTPINAELLLGAGKKVPTPIPVVFFDFDDATPKRVHYGARAMTRAQTAT